MKRLGSQNGTRPGPNTAAFADDNNHLALAVLVASKAAIDALFLEVGGLHVAAEVAAINFRYLAFTADDTALHFLCHGFTELVQQDERGLVGQAQVAAQGTQPEMSRGRDLRRQFDRGQCFANRCHGSRWDA